MSDQCSSEREGKETKSQIKKKKKPKGTTLRKEKKKKSSSTRETKGRSMLQNGSTTTN